ncbi:MAG: hypothetical protein AABW45_02485 [Nanoarchaeota archaeon]
MKITTVKLKNDTKLALNKFRYKNESYDIIIQKLISKIRNKNLKNDLIQGYQESAKYDIKSLEEWENSSKELD